jgi:hypothetical protein
VSNEGGTALPILFPEAFSLEEGAIVESPLDFQKAFGQHNIHITNYTLCNTLYINLQKNPKCSPIQLSVKQPKLFSDLLHLRITVSLITSLVV